MKTTLDLTHAFILNVGGDTSAMETCDASMTTRAWLRRPLCRRYAAVIFTTTTAPVRNLGGGQRLFSCWGLGCLSNGELEVLGAWENTSTKAALPPSAFGELHRRGAEFIDFGIGDLFAAESGFAKTFRRAALVASVEQTLAFLGASLPPRHREAVLCRLREVVNADGLEIARTELWKFQRTSLGERYPTVVRLWGEALARFEPLFALPAPLRQLVRSADLTAMEVQERLTRAIHRHGSFADSAAALDFIAGMLVRAEHRLDRERVAARVSGQAGSMPSEAVVPMSGALGVPALA